MVWQERLEACKYVSYGEKKGGEKNNLLSWKDICCGKKGGVW